MTEISKISRLGIIGDVHAEHERLALAIDHLSKLSADAMVCTGDIVDGIGCPNESVQLLVDANVHTVRGNHDRWLLEDKARHVPYAHAMSDLSEDTTTYLRNLPTFIELDTIAGRLMLCHGIGEDDLRKVWPGTERMPPERSKKLDSIISAGEFQYVINGHMHFRTIIHFDDLILINAGTLKGEHWPGFSLIDFENHEVLAYEFRDDTVHHAKTQALVENHHVIWPDTQSFTGDWEPVRLF
jgi:predicted phosphodiesterase